MLIQYKIQPHPNDGSQSNWRLRYGSFERTTAKKKDDGRGKVSFARFWDPDCWPSLFPQAGSGEGHMVMHSLYGLYGFYDWTIQLGMVCPFTRNDWSRRSFRPLYPRNFPIWCLFLLFYVNNYLIFVANCNQVTLFKNFYNLLAKRVKIRIPSWSFWSAFKGRTLCWWLPTRSP